MGDYKRDSEQDNSMDCPIWGTDDISDEELLKELEAVKNMAVPLPIPSPSPDEFEKIWARIQEERAESKNVPESDQPEHPKVIKPRFGWKRLAAIGLIACLVAGSGCMVAMGTKSYFYRERNRSGNQQDVVFNNDSSIKSVDDQETAYGVIEERLGIKSLRLGYVPAGLAFVGLEVNDRSAVMKFSYEDNTIYFVQSNDLTEASRNMKSDGKPYDVVSNKWLNKQINVKKDRIDTVLDCYEARFTYEDIFCWIYGNIAEEDFMKIIERISY